MTTVEATDTLFSLTRLSPNVYLGESSTPAGNRQPGTTIILFIWLNASPKNISTYLSGYERLDLSARIALIKSALPNLTYHSTVSQRRNLRPVVDALCARPNDSLLVHLFSNGGMQQLCVLAAIFCETTDCLLPVQGIAHDSSPSKGTFSRVPPMLMYDLPRKFYLRLPGVVVVYLLLFILWCGNNVLQRQNVLNKTRNDLNDERLITRNAEKVYIY